jgi:DNA-binding Lrp family transcriptional regulator
MSVRDVIATVNEMEKDGVIKRYAIGGAVGATFYLEPVSTLDVDVFVTFDVAPGQLIVTPKPIIDYLTARGCTMKGEYIMIGDWPVQFLPPVSALVEEALAQAVEVNVEGVAAHVFTAEHLAAIALETGRAKDKARLLQFIEEGAIDAVRFQVVVERNNLVDAWAKFERQFLNQR